MVELCISDNASNDGTEGLLKEMEQQEIIATRIHFNPKNQGFDANVLQVLSMAEGEWMWLLGDDDLPYPKGLENLLEFLLQIKDGRCVCLYLPVAWSSEGKELEVVFPPRPPLGSNDLVIDPIGFISAIVLRRSAFHSLNQKDLRRGLGTLFMHCWILRQIGLSFPESLVQAPQFPVTIAALSTPRIVLSNCLLVAAGMRKQYWGFYWLILSRRGYSSQYQSWALKKAFGANLFPYFHLLCEREFRPWKRERIPFSTFRLAFGWFTPFAMLFRIVIWRLSPKHHHALFNAVLHSVGKLHVTKRTDYDYWHQIWARTQ